MSIKCTRWLASSTSIDGATTRRDATVAWHTQSAMNILMRFRNVNFHSNYVFSASDSAKLLVKLTSRHDVEFTLYKVKKRIIVSLKPVKIEILNKENERSVRKT